MSHELECSRPQIVLCLSACLPNFFGVFAWLFPRVHAHKIGVVPYQMNGYVECLRVSRPLFPRLGARKPSPSPSTLFPGVSALLLQVPASIHKIGVVPYQMKSHVACSVILCISDPRLSQLEGCWIFPLLAILVLGVSFCFSSL